MPEHGRHGGPLWEHRNWVSLGDQFTGLKAVKYLAEHVAPERIVYKVNTVLGLSEAVDAGIGIGFLPCFIADRKPGLTRLAAPDPGFSADLWLLTHPICAIRRACACFWTSWPSNWDE